MLVLKRGVNEGVVIDGPCRIMVVEVRGYIVKLGFEASPAVHIVRDNAIKTEPRDRRKESSE
jgi:carbon storage regulator CsrA